MGKQIVSPGAITKLDSKFTKEVYCEEVVFTPETGVSVVTQNVRREGHLIVGTIWITIPSTKIERSTALGTFSRSLGSNRYIGMIGGSNPIFGSFMIDENTLKVDNNYNLLADGSYRITIVGYLNNLP